MGVFESIKRVPSSKRTRNPFRKRTNDDNNNNSILTVDQEKSFDTVRDSSRNLNKGTKLKTNVIRPNTNTNLITRRHSTNPSQLVTQAAPNGNQLNVPSPLQPQRRTRASFSGQVSPESNVDELCPYTVSPRCKPNDFILIYRDLAELVTTSIRSVRSGVGIMLNDAPHLRRRALHEESQLGTSRSITRMQERNERKNLVLWWKPFYTLWYFLLECQCLLVTYATKLYHRKKQCLLVLVVLALLTIAYNVDGQHQQFVAKTEKKVLWWLYWVVLGIMSSVGLGTGLHTFVLYLGPFIASVTLAAYECKSLAFPEPPYPSSIECPEATDAEPVSITLWSIMSKVRVEAMMWGAGTAIGELPPYFMAKAARLSGHEDEVDDDDIEEILEIEEKEKNHPAEIKQMGLMERSKVYVHDLVHRMGFFGILACASIPNPLFDLAGITCGHFLVPFWTFFGATLIGKAVIKMHIQKLVVIFAFSQHHIEFLINAIKKIPKIGEQLGNPFREYLLSQRAKLHKDSTAAPTETPWLGWIFERLIIAMVAYFILSIINSFAQNYHKRLCSNKRQSYMDGPKAH